MSTPEPTPLLRNGHHKIQPSHLQRLAYIYIRQSSMKQVLQHRESQFNQRQLVEQALALGWPADRIHVIDADQGQSGKGSSYRQGFQELVSEVSLGHVGIIFGYEVSRLARNNSDWYHLLDLAAVFGTLIADSDGLYDLRLYNDRLLLGLKGTLSEAELHLLRQRLDAGRLSQVRRGVYRQWLPTGLIRLPDGTVVLDPDDQVRHTIEIVFAKFQELRSCGKVLRALRQHQILLPRRQRGGVFAGKLLWREPTDSAIYEIVRNPAYAGAFVYGRKQVDPTRAQPGRPATGRIARPRSQWLHLQQNVYPAYITWEQYLANQDQLERNGMIYREQQERAHGAVREGAALLQGVVVCGLCGYQMSVGYKRHPTYVCAGLTRRYGEPNCQYVHGPAVEAVVIQAFFEAVQPAQLDALEGVLAAQRLEHERVARHWAERLKRAQYEVRLAERQYDTVDPDNRLVAAELERRWEVALRGLHETQEAYERFQRETVPAELPPAWRDAFQHLSTRLPEVWSQLTASQKKELLRSLIARVILTRRTPEQVEVKIVWISGHYSVVTAQVPVHRNEHVAGYEAMIPRVHDLWDAGLTDAEIAARLTAEGFRAARATSVSALVVMKIRLANRWHSAYAQGRNALEFEGCLTVRGLAARLGVDRSWVYRRIADGMIDARYIKHHPQGGLCLIADDPDLIKHLKHRLATTKPE